MRSDLVVRPHGEQSRPLFGWGSALVDDTVAVVLAGGKGTRLEQLTRDICRPALPFGASYRSIDFSLSNCVNSGIRMTPRHPTSFTPSLK
jgi:hypothetical protein